MTPVVAKSEERGQLAHDVQAPGLQARGAQSCGASSCGAPPARSRCRAAVEYTIENDLRFISHHDEMRLLTRAAVRAGWPLAYSQGYNPVPRVTIPLPRSVGIAAMSQWALVDLRVPDTGDQQTDKPGTGVAFLDAAALAAQLPADCRLLRVIVPATLSFPQATAVRYELPLEGEHDFLNSTEWTSDEFTKSYDELRTGCDELAKVAERIAALMQSGEWIVKRCTRPDRPAQRVDVRPFLERLWLENGRLCMVLRVDGQRSARPAEILDIIGLPADAHAHRVIRMAVQWNIDLSVPLQNLSHKPVEHRLSACANYVQE